MKEQALTVFSKTLLVFPDICGRCGTQTDKKIAVKIGAGNPALKPAMLLAGHVGHLVEGIKELHSGSTKVPCCPQCYQYLIIGRWLSLVFLLLGGALFFIVVRYASKWPDWLMISTGFFAFVMLVGAFIPHMIGEKKSAPMTIWRQADGYYYLFHSGVYRHWAERLASQQKLS